MKRKQVIKTAKRIINESHLWSREEVIYAEMMLREEKLRKQKKKEEKKLRNQNVENMG